MDGSFPSASPPGPPQQSDTDWHRPMLRELAEIGMCLARRAAAVAEQEADPAAPAALAFSRLARSVRQTVALDARLAAAHHAAADTAAAERARRARTEARRRDHRRTELHRRLAQTIRDSADPSEAESLLADLDDRLDDADIHAALDHTPIARIVAGLCTEWGITPDLADWTDEELAAAASPPRPP